MGENPIGRKGKGSCAMSISAGLVGPKRSLKRVIAKGNQVHIPEPRLEIGNDRVRSDTCG